MKNVKFVDTVKKSTYKIGFELKKRSPEILMVAGVVGTVVSTVIACKATTKIGDILESTKEDVDTIHSFVADKEVDVDYTEKDEKRDLTIVYAQAGVKLINLYAPALALGALSITSIVASNSILRKRNVAIAAAYAAVDRGFKEYRHRVVERFGDDVDLELRHGVKVHKVNSIVEDEDGKQKKIKENINVVGTRKLGDYEFFFDETSPYWEKNADYNRMFLLAQQQYANNKLRAKGFLYLNDVLKAIGIPETKAGQVTGWIFNEDRPNGDNFIDFGIYEAYRQDEILYDKEQARADKFSKDKYDRVMLLDFNVDGNIWELM